jgi:uncharacterized protein (TIGR02118 family)
VGPRVTDDRAALRRPGMLAGPAVASRAASLLNPFHCRALLFPLAVMSDRVGKEAVVEGASRVRRAPAPPPRRGTVIELIYCFRRRPDLSAEELDAHWSRVHGAIGARIPGLRRLVQSRAVPVPGDVRPPDFDGVAELWFDDVDAFLRARASEAWREATLDEANFLDPRTTAYLVTEERTILERPAP